MLRIAFVCRLIITCIRILPTYLPVHHCVYGLAGNIHLRYPLHRILNQNTLLLVVSEGKSIVKVSPRYITKILYIYIFCM